MIYQMVIIVILVAIPSNYITTQVLVQLIIRPYQSVILNIFDGFVLQIMALVSMIPLIELIDDVDQDLLWSITLF